MATLDELIKARLEEKRQEKTEQARKESEELAEQKRREALVVSIFSKRLEEMHGVDMATFPYALVAELNNVDTFEVWIEIAGNDGFPRVDYNWWVILHEDKRMLEITQTKKKAWSGVHDEENANQTSNLIDAIIYALHGTLDPDKISTPTQSEIKNEPYYELDTCRCGHYYRYHDSDGCGMCECKEFIHDKVPF